MSRSRKIDVVKSFSKPSGRIPVLEESPFHMHSKPCWLCTKGHRYKQQQSKSDRRANKSLLQREIDVFWKEYADEVMI